MSDTTTRRLDDIACEILADWPIDKMFFGAVPYVKSLLELDSINDRYGADRARDIVSYFLSNATTWRGETARRVKAELKAMLAASR